MKECPCCKNVTDNFGVNIKLCRKCNSMKAKTRYSRYGYESSIKLNIVNAISKTCPICEEAFITTHKTKVYCSVACGKKKYRKNRGKQYNKEYAVNNPEKHKAQQTLGRAIYEGAIRRVKVCELCLVDCKTHAHHVDYSKPLFVWWLCPKCHVKVHQKHSPTDILGESTEECLYLSI